MAKISEVQQRQEEKQRELLESRRAEVLRIHETTCDELNTSLMSKYESTLARTIEDTLAEQRESDYTKLAWAFGIGWVFGMITFAALLVFQHS
jgi:cysteinyl-tRNA synthetase